MDRSLRALNRFGLGARPGQRRGIGDERAWLLAQLEGRGESPDVASIGDLDAIAREVREAQRSRDQERVAAARAAVRDLRLADASSVLSLRVRSERPFVERLVAFWANHLCVSATGELQVALLAGDYERAVIRPHVVGRFKDMVLASARHPAMLVYLDNFRSVGPGSRAGRQSGGRGSAPRGLNENYARELLELHTVGVNGGYEQTDVVELARILTGWSVAGAGPQGGRGRGPDNGSGYVFRALAHEPGDKTVMGRRYRESGEREGEAVIRDLCAHPSTASFVAGKLVRHFVSDDPPQASVDHVASVFRDTDGDLLEVSRSLVDLEAAWEPGSRKLRTPQDWLVATLRALGAEEMSERAVPLLQQLRHPLWAPQAPRGFGDAVVDWADPDSLLNRAELARSLTRLVARDAPRDPRELLDVMDLEEDDPLVSLLDDTNIPGPERMALAVGGPAFQWR